MSSIVGQNIDGTFTVQADDGTVSSLPSAALPTDLLAQAALLKQPGGSSQALASTPPPAPSVTPPTVMPPPETAPQSPGLFTGDAWQILNPLASKPGSPNGPSAADVYAMVRGKPSTETEADLIGKFEPTTGNKAPALPGGPSLEQQIVDAVKGSAVTGGMNVRMPGMGGGEALGDIRTGFQMQQIGKTEEARVMSELGQQEHDIITSNLPEKEKFAAWTQAHAADQEAWVKKHMDDLDRKTQDLYNSGVDPGRYLSSMNTAERFGTILAMGMGGLQQAHLGLHDNPVMTMINNNINRDVDAQVKQLENKRSLIAEGRNQVAQYLSAGADIETAKAKAKEAQWDAHVLAPLTAIAAGAKGDMARARATDLLGQAQEEKGKAVSTVELQATDAWAKKAMIDMDLAKLKVAQSAPNLLPLLLEGPVSDQIWNQMPSEIQKQRIPLGNGTSIAAVDATEATKPAREEVARFQTIMPMMQRLKMLREKSAHGQLSGPDFYDASSTAGALMATMLKDEEVARGMSPEAIRVMHKQVSDHPLSILNFFEKAKEASTIRNVLTRSKARIQAYAPGFPGFGSDSGSF